MEGPYTNLHMSQKEEPQRMQIKSKWNEIVPPKIANMGVWWGGKGNKTSSMLRQNATAQWEITQYRN